jgi:glucuronosyltransferase
LHTGGLHFVPPKLLPKDLESFFDGSVDLGFIIVSFASVLKGVNIPKTSVAWFCPHSLGYHRGFCGNGKINPGKTIPFHPTSNFSSGCLNRIYRAIRKSVCSSPTADCLVTKRPSTTGRLSFCPLSMTSRSTPKTQKAHDDGYAIRLDWDNLTEEILYDAIHLILTNSKFVTIHLSNVAGLNL